MIDLSLCTRCGLCLAKCRQEAITGDYQVREYRCIGCGDCEKLCQFGAVSYKHKKADYNGILRECRKEGTETMELHTSKT